MFVFALRNPRDPNQFLRPQLASNRDDQAAADLELRSQRVRNLRSARSHDDGIVRRMLRPTAPTVAVPDVHVIVSAFGQRHCRLFRQLADPLDAVDVGCDLGEDRRRVTGASADFQDFFAAF
jgi:hypothetical protein